MTDPEIVELEPTPTAAIRRAVATVPLGTIVTIRA